MTETPSNQGHARRARERKRASDRARDVSEGPFEQGMRTVQLVVGFSVLAFVCSYFLPVMLRLPACGALLFVFMHIRERGVKATHSIPRELSLRGMIVSQAILTLLIGSLRAMGASTRVTLSLMGFVVAVGMGQVVLRRWPRLGSMLGGAVALPIVMLPSIMPPSMARAPGFDLGEALLVGLNLVTAGSILGYLVGLVLAGCVLIQGLIVERFTRER